MCLFVPLFLHLRQSLQSSTIWSVCKFIINESIASDYSLNEAGNTFLCRWKHSEVHYSIQPVSPEPSASLCRVPFFYSLYSYYPLLLENLWPGDNLEFAHKHPLQKMSSQGMCAPLLIWQDMIRSNLRISWSPMLPTCLNRQQVQVSSKFLVDWAHTTNGFNVGHTHKMLMH